MMVEGTVYVVDDDASVRRGFERLLGASGFAVESFGAAEDFLETRVDEGPACLLLDIKMPGLSGLDLQVRLRETGRDLPIVFITGHGDIPSTVQAMRSGAVDFLPKPVAEESLLASVRRSLDKDLAGRAKRQHHDGIGQRLGRLTPREREVFGLVVRGKLNKQIAFELGPSEKTVKVHRGRVMQKMEAESLAELVRMANTVGL